MILFCHNKKTPPSYIFSYPNFLCSSLIQENFKNGVQAFGYHTEFSQGLEGLESFSKMDLYAIVSIHGDYFNNNNNNANQHRTHIDKDYDPNPKWKFPMKFTVDISAAEQNRLLLVVKIKAEKKLAGDEEVGKAHVPIK